MKEVSKVTSVIIPTKNRKDIIGRAINSVLAQRDAKVEIIVVDDGSSDATADYIKSEYPNILLVTNALSVGGAKARNIGAEHATGEYVAFLDSDDEWLPDHLKTKIEILETTNIDGVYGAFYLRDDSSQLREIRFWNSFKDKTSIADKIASFKTHDTRTSTFVFRREAFCNIKFDEKLIKHQDWDLAINFEQKYKLLLHEEPTVIIHIDSSHSRMSNNLKHNATLYFLNKNKESFKAISLYNFCIKMIMRCQASGEENSKELYLAYIKKVLPGLSVKEGFVYQLLRYKMINLNTVRILRSKISNML